MGFLLQWDLKMDVCRDAPWHVPTGVGLWMGFMIIGIFYGTMCTSSLHLMKYCDSGMDFLIAMEF